MPLVFVLSVEVVRPRPTRVPGAGNAVGGRAPTRRVRDIAYAQIVVIELTVGEYRAACTCGKTFRCRDEGIEPRAEYTNRVRDAVIDRLLDDGTSLHRVQQAMHRDFLLELSDGFLSDCLDWKVRQTDTPGYRQWALKHFSGTLCIDELHLGHRARLSAHFVRAAASRAL